MITQARTKANSMFNRSSEYQILKRNSRGVFKDFEEQIEAKDYSGCKYVYDKNKVIQRTAKITPKKNGQFVSLWKRCTETNETIPFHAGDDFDFVVIVCIKENDHGYFLFSKDVLVDKGILSTSGADEGKRGFRVYPSWDKPTSKQALLSQEWQLKYFSKQLMLKF